MENLLKDIRIKPARGPEHTIWSYYYGLAEFDRTSNDTQAVPKQGTTVIIAERTLPIIIPDDNNKITEFLKLTKKFADVCHISQSPIPCCSRKRRTSCLCCFRPIFGGHKQMGMILGKTF